MKKAIAVSVTVFGVLLCIAAVSVVPPNLGFLPGTVPVYNGGTGNNLSAGNISGVMFQASATSITNSPSLVYTNGNFGLGLSTFGASAAKVLAIGSGTAPTTSPFDAVQLWSADRGGTAGKAGLHIRTEDGTSHVFGDLVGIGTTAPSRPLDVHAIASVIQASSDVVTNYSAVIASNGGGNFYLARERSAGGLLASDSLPYAGIISAVGNYPLQLAINSAAAMTILTGGNVGIGTTTPNSTLHVAGSFAKNIAFGGSATLGATNSTYVLTTSGDTVTLPTAVGIAGRIYTVIMGVTGTGTIATTSSQTIDGAGSYALSAQYKRISVQSGGTNWWITGNN